MKLIFQEWKEAGIPLKIRSFRVFMLPGVPRLVLSTLCLMLLDATGGKQIHVSS
jgi:hypothetical protein